MTTKPDPTKSVFDAPEPAPRKPLTPEAQRALAEAAERRAQAAAEAAAEAQTKGEFGGRGGLEPTRYGDWEIKGLTADF